MAKYKRQKVKRYRRSFYSRGTRIKKGIGIVVLVLAVTFVLVNTLVDLLYAAVDPRVKYD